MAWTDDPNYLFRQLQDELVARRGATSTAQSVQLEELRLRVEALERRAWGSAAASLPVRFLSPPPNR